MVSVVLSTIERSGFSTQVTVQAQRPSGLSLPKLSRAHLLLAEHPELAVEAAELLSRTAAALAPELEVDFSVVGHLIRWAKSLPMQFPATSCVAVIDLAVSEKPMLVELELDFAIALVSCLAGESTKPGPVTALTRLEEAALGYLLLVALRSTRAVEGWPALLGARLSAIQSGVSKIEGRGVYVGVDVDLKFSNERGHLRCWVPSEALQRAWIGLTPQPPGLLGEALGNCSLPLRCSLFPAELPTGELQSLVPRDVILFGAQSAWAPARLTASTFELEGHFTPSGFELGAVHPHPLTCDLPETTMTETLRKTPAVNSAEPLRVELEIELARKQLTLAQLTSLTPGMVLPLQMGISEPVSLRVGDRLIGTGELVDVEGEVGVRVLTLIR